MPWSPGRSLPVPCASPCQRSAAAKPWSTWSLAAEYTVIWARRQPSGRSPSPLRGRVLAWDIS